MDSLIKILDRTETTQNEILDKMSSPDNADNLVELQLNLARAVPAKRALSRQQPANHFPLPIYKKVFRTEKKRSLHCLEC